MNNQPTLRPLRLLSLGKFVGTISLAVLLTVHGLDGGGIRGYAELLILHEIMGRIKIRRNLNRLPRPHEHFVWVSSPLVFRSLT